MIRQIARAMCLAITFLAARVAAAQQQSDTRVGVSLEAVMPAHQLSQVFDAAPRIELFGQRSFRERHSPQSWGWGIGRSVVEPPTICE